MITGRSFSRIALNVLLDGALAALAAPLAWYLVGPDVALTHPLRIAAASAVALLLAGVPFGLSLQYWRFAGVGDLLAVAASSVLAALATWLLLRLDGIGVPALTFPAVHALALLVLLAAPRAIYRQLRARGRANDEEGDAQPVLLIGDGEDLDLFLRAIAQDRARVLRVVGVLSLGSRQAGRRILGHAILGSSEDLPDVLERLKAEGKPPAAIVIVSPGIAGPALSAILDEAEQHGMPVRSAPRPTALAPPTRRDKAPGAAGTPGIELKPVAIEDLLNRAQVPLDREGMARLIQGRRVLVTGAGGTIGSELARQVARLGPASLMLLDNGEFALWQIDLELGETLPGVDRRCVIADIRDEARIRGLIEDFRPELVFHAAALKHVPMVEANPREGLLTNVVGTRYVADAARAAGAVAMVLISTDKAVNPSSVMGASKRLAEMYCQALDIAARTTGTGMRCITVRFGNVLGSTGSVVPLFRRQLERGGPLTVTHPDMQRYFMTVREAVGLVLQASVLGAGDAVLPSGRDGGIFVLDMGKPVKIVDLARRMIRLAGLRPDADVEIRFTGLRPGEKLHEELFHGREAPVPTGFDGLLMANPRTSDAAIVGRAIEEIAAACRGGQERLALTLLARQVPEFAHNSEGGGATARA